MLRRVAPLVAKRPWVRKVAVTLPGARDVAWRFVAGEDLEAGLAAARRLNSRSIAATLSYVGGHVRSEDEAVAAADMAREALRRVHEQGLESHVSLKLTQIGLDIDRDLCRSQLRRVLDEALRFENFVRIDMEESAYTGQTIDLFEEVRDAYGPATVGIAVQSYLRNRHGDLDRLLGGASRVRLVKGGYWEAPEVVYRRKGDVDRAFLRDIGLLLARGHDPAIATHDEAAIDHARRTAAQIGLDNRAFEFQMLYGVRRDLGEALVGDGARVRCYVPYGGQWFEYVLGCVRRLPDGALRRVAGRWQRGGRRGVTPAAVPPTA